MCGSRVYGTGFRSDRTIAVFDTSVPGRDGCIARLGKTRRSRDGQKGVPSALAFPDGGRGPTGVFAAGTYSPASIRCIGVDGPRQVAYTAVDGSAEDMRGYHA